MSKANPDAIFVIVSVGRGEEVTNDVIDGNQSVVWRQALNKCTLKKVL